MGRINYSLMGRYLLTGSIRRDGFSPFGLQFPRSTYPTGAVAWVVSDEKFMKTKTFDWLNYAKLRVSYGVNGNRLATGHCRSITGTGIGKYCKNTQLSAHRVQ